MPLIEDHEQVCPTIPEAQLQYVLNLDDTYKSYTRFLAALLIPRPSYAAFFRDIRSFRSQPTTIALLSSCDSSQASLTRVEIRQTYREITALFLQSRWSHPWCRKAAGNQDATTGSTGWWGAHWASTGRRMDKKERVAEDRLHQLLLPIWVIIRGRMFPGEDVVMSWWKQKQEKDETQRQQQQLGLEKGVLVWLGKVEVDPIVTEIQVDNSPMEHGSDSEDNSSPVSNNPFRKGGEHTLRPVKTAPNLRQDFWDSAEAEQLEHDLRIQQHQQSAQVATSAFRLVATSMLLSTIPNWKLKRLLKSKS